MMIVMFTIDDDDDDETIDSDKYKCRWLWQ